MSSPTISVILPAYNSAKYLAEAIDSVLQQTFTDFELLVINDGSTDHTEMVIQGYNDPRIVYLKNDRNRGLIYSLNLGLQKAKGFYIARMDGDDISLPERFQRQIEYLQKHEGVDVLAARVTLINENNEPIDAWKEDVMHTDTRSIRKYLPINNCIAHPTIMARRQFIDQYKYDPDQKLSEDYDLWLRIASNGGVIDKLPLPLLQHRILQTSFTRTRKINVYFKIFLVKWIFIKKQVASGKLNLFIFSTFVYAVSDIIKGIGKEVGRTLRH